MSQRMSSKILSLPNWRYFALVALLLFGCAVQLVPEYQAAAVFPVCSANSGGVLSTVCAAVEPIQTPLVCGLFILLSMPWKSMIASDPSE